jgi:hypothetical protein
VILRYDLENNQTKSPITSIEVAALESSFKPGAKLVSFFPTHIKPFESNINEKLIKKYSEV